jgi:Zn-dependent peptidase ImmA (M78 family)
MRAGDPAAFSFSMAFSPNPHGTTDHATAEARESWGSFQVWAGGENLCAHREQGEVIQSSYWYLLPLMEWLADTWDPLFHEERLPLRNGGASAAASLAKTRLPPISLKQVDDFDWLDTWSEWWSRHSIRSAREGGLFPDIYLRRYRDQLEVSTGAEPLPGMPSHFGFLAPCRAYHADLLQAAEAIHQVLTAATGELRRRLPGSGRVEALAEKVASLASPTREASRVAWLAGIGEKYSQIADAVNRTLSTAGENVRRGILATRPASPLVIVGSAYARLLYGAVSPDTDLEDVVRLTSRIISNYVEDASPWLAALDVPLETDEVSALPPGEQGSRLGEKACELLSGDSDGWVNAESIARRLGIKVSEMAFSDADVRAVSVFGPTQCPHVFRNANTRWGSSSEVARFTLAHELCHLLLDREYGDELAIASGPWAPLAIEQRANAFAAAFLMPTWLLRDLLATATAPADDPDTIRSVSAALRVSASSLIDRLFNLDEITFDDRIRLRALWPRGQ